MASHTFNGTIAGKGRDAPISHVSNVGNLEAHAWVDITPDGRVLVAGIPVPYDWHDRIIEGMPVRITIDVADAEPSG